VVCYYLPERAVVAPGSTKSVYQWRQHPDDKAEVFRQLGLKLTYHPGFHECDRAVAFR
jgi:hypothetical protein